MTHTRKYIPAYRLSRPYANHASGDAPHIITPSQLMGDPSAADFEEGDPNTRGLDLIGTTHPYVFLARLLRWGPGAAVNAIRPLSYDDQSGSSAPPPYDLEDNGPVPQATGVQGLMDALANALN